MLGLAALGAVAAVGGAVAAIEVSQPDPVPVRPAPVPLTRLVGQRLMVGFSGTRTPQSLLARVRKGQVGGVILMGENVSSHGQVRRLTRSLQRAARAGGNPPLLVATDQEGGLVKRLPGAPTLAAAQMRTPATATAQGAATGRLLRSVGIGADLAPVADVPASDASFIARQRRAFSRDPAQAGRLAGAFAAALQARGPAATAKHFPGLGEARTSTDDGRVALRLSDAAFARGVAPYRALIDRGVRMVMLAVASYPAQDPSGRPAALSAAMVGRLRSLGFGGVTITDSLDGPTGVPTAKAGAAALRAGTDIALYVSDAPHAYREMLAAARRVPRARLIDSYLRIVAVKRSLSH